jgi:hypothetical protein
MPFRSLAIFEAQPSISRNTLARFLDVNEKSYSNLYDNEDRIADYLEGILSNKKS